jgi:phosphopantothenoylcysteine decarboxylase/phosphopantothenate--cysteine ligase
MRSSEGEGRGYVLLAVCGGIAAYKACEVLRSLQKAGRDVRVVMTEDATRFVGTVTFEALSKHPVVTSLYGNPGDPIPHISLAEGADLALVVPATANVMAKMAAGIADDALTSTLLATTCPVLVAPAMNVHMWRNLATQANVATLGKRGVRFVMPDSGMLACGEVGEGKLAPVNAIASTALGALGDDDVTRDLEGVRLLVTAGPTHEAIDPVRYIANSSSGKMGYAIATAAAARGADVTLVSGPVSLAAPASVRVVSVVSASQMRDAAVDAFHDCDAAICAAAVSDYTPAEPADHKLKKSSEPLSSISLVETADILAELCSVRGGRPVVGFAAETTDLLQNAERKLRSKGASMIVANDVSRDDSTFGSDTDRVAFVSADGVEEFPCLPKAEVASRILDRLSPMIRVAQK